MHYRFDRKLPVHQCKQCLFKTNRLSRGRTDWQKDRSHKVCLKMYKLSIKCLAILIGRDILKTWNMNILPKNGEVKSTILNTKVININGQDLAIASFIDLTEILSLKKAEKEINEFNHYWFNRFRLEWKSLMNHKNFISGS